MTKATDLDASEAIEGLKSLEFELPSHIDNSIIQAFWNEAARTGALSVYVNAEEVGGYIFMATASSDQSKFSVCASAGMEIFFDRDLEELLTDPGIVGFEDRPKLAALLRRIADKIVNS